MGAGSYSGAINLALLGGMIIFDFRIKVEQVSQLPFECYRNPQKQKVQIFDQTFQMSEAPYVFDS